MKGSLQGATALNSASEIIFSALPCRYFLYLGTRVKEVLSRSIPPEFAQHVLTNFNARYKDLVTPTCHLALLLHPFYRDVFKHTKHSFGYFLNTAVGILRGHRMASQQAAAALGSQLGAYVQFR